MKTKHIVIIVIIILLGYLLLHNKNCEGLDATSNTPTLSNEAIQSISSIYSNTSGTSTFNNVKATGKITGKQFIGDMSGNVTGNVTGNLMGDVSGTKLCIGSTCITEKELQQITSNKKCAGFAVDGTGTTMPLYEGFWKIYGGNDETTRRFDSWTNDTWDMVYIYKGWKVQFWSDDKSGATVTVENKDDDIPKTKWLSNNNLSNSVSSYEATWVGY
jgi:hypothetical protein